MFNLLGIFVENVAENIQKSLTIMWQGVLAIFIVIGVTITYVLNKITAPKKTNTTTDDDEE